MTPKTVLNIHPKVFTALLIGLAIAVLGAVVGYVTPASLSFLGVWEAPAFALFTALASSLGAWLKKADSEATAPDTTPAAAPVADDSAGTDATDVVTPPVDPVTVLAEPNAPAASSTGS